MTDEIKPALTAKEWSTYRAPETFGFSRHALAALALQGQPFGFTWDDVSALDDAVNEFRVKGIAPIDPRSAEYNATADAIQAVADRIASLLPPRE